MLTTQSILTWGITRSEEGQFQLKSPETPDEIRSRLKLAEIEAEHKLRTQEAEDTYKRRISLIVHIFVMAMVAVVFLASAYIAVAGVPKTGLPDKAICDFSPKNREQVKLNAPSDPRFTPGRQKVPDLFD